MSNPDVDIFRIDELPPSINYGRWIFRIVAWDGILPVLVYLAPAGIQLLFPGRRGAIELTAIVFPIAAFLMRGLSGYRVISTNSCRPKFREGQLLAFGLAIFLLVFVEAVMMLSHLMPKGEFFKAEQDRRIAASVAFVYLACMTFAMYPGRSREILTRSEHDEQPDQ